MLSLMLACSSQPLGVDYNGQNLTVVDLHLHNGEWENIPSGTKTFLANNFPFPFSLDAEETASSVLSTEGVIEQLDQAGVEYGVLLAVYAPRTVGVSTNEMILERVSAAPGRLWGMASLSVEDWGEAGETSLAALETALAAPEMIGIKLAHPHMHKRMDDARYFGIYDIAERTGAPVYVHTGPSLFPGTRIEPAYTDPRYLEEAIRSYPDADFILGHACYDFIEDDIDELETCLDLISRYDNVWLEISALGSSEERAEQYREVIQRIRDGGFIGRTLYGSDGPQRPGFVGIYLQNTVDAMQAAGYSADEASAVLSGNFSALYGVSL